MHSYVGTELYKNKMSRYKLFSLVRVVLSLGTCLTLVQGEDAYQFTVYSQANIFSSMSGFLYYPTPHTGCYPLEPPPSNSTWFALLDDYNSCPLAKLINTRNAGYLLLFTYSVNDTDRHLTYEVTATKFPIAVIRQEQAEYFKSNATTPDEGSVYITVELIIVEGDLAVNVTVVDNSSLPVPPSQQPTPGVSGFSAAPLAVFVCVCSILVIGVSVMAVVQCAKKWSTHRQHRASQQQIASKYGATEHHRSINSRHHERETQLVEQRTGGETQRSTGREKSVQMIHMDKRHGVQTTRQQQQTPHSTTQHHSTQQKKFQRHLSLPEQSSHPTVQYSYTHPQPPQSPSDTRTASWVYSHFVQSQDSTDCIKPRRYNADSDGCTPACIVCLAKFKTGEHIVALPCDRHHIFHPKCIKDSLAKCGKKCPLCNCTV